MGTISTKRLGSRGEPKRILVAAGVTKENLDFDVLTS